MEATLVSASLNNYVRSLYYSVYKYQGCPVWWDSNNFRFQLSQLRYAGHELLSSDHRRYG